MNLNRDSSKLLYLNVWWKLFAICILWYPFINPNLKPLTHPRRSLNYVFSTFYLVDYKGQWLIKFWRIGTCQLANSHLNECFYSLIGIFQGEGWRRCCLIESLSHLFEGKRDLNHLFFSYSQISSSNSSTCLLSGDDCLN